MTHYPMRKRRNPWFPRFAMGAILLTACLIWWLDWQPPPKQNESARDLLGYAPRTTSNPSTNQPTPPTDNPTDLPDIDIPPELELLPSRIADSLVSTAPPLTPFKPNPSLIIPPAPSHAWPARPVDTVLEAQIALGRLGFSCGPIDGLNGPKTRRAIEAFQQLQDIPKTGKLDLTTKSHLLLTEPPLTRFTITTQDLQRLTPIPSTWIGKANATRLEFETLIEMVSERSHANPNLIRQLNQNLDWRNLHPGSALTVPSVRPPTVRAKAASIKIHLDSRVLEVFDAITNRIALFPCSIAREVQNRLVGRLQITTIAHEPEYLFVPSRFRQTPEVRQIKQNLSIPPGPNNPVGLVWIGLDRPGYGIHGSPTPERIGEAESLGCFRLTNWDAQLLAQLSWPGMPVDITH